MTLGHMMTSARPPRKLWPLVLMAALAALAGAWWITRTPAVSADFADQRYADASERNVLDVYKPTTGSGPAPLVLFIHGGAFKMGDKADIPALNALRKAGFAVASMNYRFSKEAQYPAQIDDLRAAVRFLRANAAKFGIDPDRIGVWGASAGGYLASQAGIALAADPATRVQAVVDWFGPVDFGTMDADMAATGKTAKMGPTNDAGSAESALIGGAVGTNPDEATAASTLTALKAVPTDVPVPPFLIMHGKDDVMIAWPQSERLAKALKARGGDGAAELHVLDGTGHGDGAFKTDAVKGQVVDFFKAKLATSARAVAPVPAAAPAQ